MLIGRNTSPGWSENRTNNPVELARLRSNELRRGRLEREGRQVGREIKKLQQDAVSASEVDRQLKRMQELARRRDALS